MSGSTWDMNPSLFDLSAACDLNLQQDLFAIEAMCIVQLYQLCHTDADGFKLQ